MADLLRSSNGEPHEYHGWEMRDESAPLGWRFHVCEGVLPTFKIYAEVEFGPGMQTLIDSVTRLEAKRREHAIRESLKAGVGLRIDVYAYRTEYRLDPSVPPLTIEEHDHAGE